MKNRTKQHKTPDQVIEMLKAANDQNSNLLLNTGPLPDGSIHPESSGETFAVVAPLTLC